jgi:hypothetical protein
MYFSESFAFLRIFCVFCISQNLLYFSESFVFLRISCPLFIAPFHELYKKHEFEIYRQLPSDCLTDSFKLDYSQKRAPYFVNGVSVWDGNNLYPINISTEPSCRSSGRRELRSTLP